MWVVGLAFTCYYDFSGETLLCIWWRINHFTLADVLATIAGCDFKLTGERSLCRARLLSKGGERGRESIIWRDIEFRQLVHNLWFDASVDPCNHTQVWGQGVLTTSWEHALIPVAKFGHNPVILANGGWVSPLKVWGKKYLTCWLWPRLFGKGQAVGRWVDNWKLEIDWRLLWHGETVRWVPLPDECANIMPLVWVDNKYCRKCI